MATEETPGDQAQGNTDPAGETAGQQQAVSGSTPPAADTAPSGGGGNQGAGAAGSAGEAGGGDDGKKALLDDLYKERRSRKSAQAQVESLKSELSKSASAVEQRDAVQRKYDRLEGFLTKVGGPLGKALDSKSFTARLFESDDSLDELAKAWQKENPTKTSVALSSDNAAPGDKKPTMNDLLRAAMK